MARIAPLDRDEAAPAAQAQYDQIVASQGRLTNMKRTLGHNAVALRAYMEWYPLREEVLPFLGERATLIFVHAISHATDCLICSTYFRRILIERGENPDALQLDEREALLVEYARQLVRDAHQVSDALFARLAQCWSPGEIVALTAFGGLMVATNLFNNALRVDLDDYLAAYRQTVEEGAAQPAGNLRA